MWAMRCAITCGPKISLGQEIENIRRPNYVFDFDCAMQFWTPVLPQFYYFGVFILVTTLRRWPDTNEQRHTLRVGTSIPSSHWDHSVQPQPYHVVQHHRLPISQPGLWATWTMKSVINSHPLGSLRAWCWDWISGLAELQASIELKS